MTYGYAGIGLASALLTTWFLGCASAPPQEPSDVHTAARAFQLDAKGVDIQPWLAAFISQVRGNWFIPQIALSRRGHVVIGFDLEKDGRILNIRLQRSSGIEAFDKSALWAISASNPTRPLPADHKEPRVPLTVTFYFNMERAPGP